MYTASLFPKGIFIPPKNHLRTQIYHYSLIRDMMDIAPDMNNPVRPLNFVFRIVMMVFQLSVAALAVACRGFLNMATLSSHTKAKAAEKTLGPAIEFTPQLLIIPVLLFIVGLLNSILGLEVVPVPVATASEMSLLSIAGIVGLLTFALLNASVRPESSPFQSTLSRVIHNMILTNYMRRSFMPLESTYHDTYHEIVQTTHDGDTLDKAAASLFGIPQSPAWPQLHFNDTLIHLLSPEASIRCNQTAAQAIIDLQDISYTQNYRSVTTLWTSTYIKAFTVVVGAFHQEHPAAVCIFGSGYVSDGCPRTSSMDHLLLEIFFNYFLSISPDDSLTPAMVKLFEPDFIVPRNVLSFIPLLHQGIETEREKVVTLVTLLMAAKTLTVVMSAAREKIFEGRLVSIRIAAVVVEAFLKFSEPVLGLNDSRLLTDFCSTSLVAVRRWLELEFESNYWLDIVQSTEMALARMTPSPVSAALAELIEDCRLYPQIRLYPAPRIHRRPRGKRVKTAIAARIEL
ncbi:hypothetical protein DFH09DRAFT_1301542 [Mycena vulgaris]|nr:hypothetical protein DFH09DRAFT_1301542 [Mycena vulgaris]